MMHFNLDNPLYKAFCAVRAPLTRLFRPRKGYFLAREPQRSLTPISTKFGFDRGTPIDRYYIEKFLAEYKQHIQGKALEVHDDAYIQRYGEGRVTETDILDIDTTNTLATVYGDIQNLTNVPDNTYDCLIVTQTFGLFNDHRAAARECWRILKPGGSLLATFSTLGPLREAEQTHWRFTPLGVKHIFEHVFPPAQVKLVAYGNVLAGQSFLVGLGAEELSEEELHHVDPWYPLIMGLHAVK